MQAMPLQTLKKVILGGPRGTRQKTSELRPNKYPGHQQFKFSLFM
jgi:hypothetical protein